MSNIFILNGHQPYDFAPGRLNAAMVDLAERFFSQQGHAIRFSRVAEHYKVDEEISNHQWADIVLMQFPVNWMGVSWRFKQYMDEVYSAGMDGRLCNGDGRTAEAPKANYGMGGSLGTTQYMLSATLNAPAEAFDDAAEPFFQGLSLDDLLRPLHLNAKFFGMKPLPTFAAFDVMKNPQVEQDFIRYSDHLEHVFGSGED